MSDDRSKICFRESGLSLAQRVDNLVPVEVVSLDSQSLLKCPRSLATWPVRLPHFT
jgi:hypothetical protein